MNIDMEYVLKIIKLLTPGIKSTLYMVSLSSLFSILLGSFIGIVLYITEKDGIQPSRVVSEIVGTIVNIGRSIPFVIIIIAVFPLSRFIVGTAIGTKAAIVPLSIAAAPFFARVIESTLKEVDKGIIEAAICMGATNWQVITKVLIPESAQGIVLAITITIINIIGYSAMAGMIGGGGLGDIALRIGYQAHRTDVLIYCIIILVIMVQIVQAFGNYLSKNIVKLLHTNNKI